METRISEIADGIYRLSNVVRTPISADGFTFNQFLILGDEPLLFHTGLRKMFESNREAVAKIIPLDRLRWIAFGHFEADECGAMNEWLAAAPMATPAHGQIGCLVSLTDFSDRSPRALADGETIEIGEGRVVRFLDTPHTPHGWDAGVIFEESTRTLLCGDLFTQFGDRAESIDGDVVGPAIIAEDVLKYSANSPFMGTTIRTLAGLQPAGLALMHGPSFRGNAAEALVALGDDYDRRLREAMDRNPDPASSAT